MHAKTNTHLLTSQKHLKYNSNFPLKMFVIPLVRSDKIKIRF